MRGKRGSERGQLRYLLLKVANRSSYLGGGSRQRGGGETTSRKGIAITIPSLSESHLGLKERGYWRSLRVAARGRKKPEP